MSYQSTDDHNQKPLHPSKSKFKAIQFFERVFLNNEAYVHYNFTNLLK